MTNLRELVEREIERFIEWEGDDKSIVTTTSTKLFAEHVAKLYADHIAQDRKMVSDHIPDAGKMVTRPQIREAFLRNGARIEPDRDDLPDWVYESVFELLEMAAPAVQREPVAWLEGEPSMRGATLSNLTALTRSTRLHLTKPGTSNPVWPLYTAPQPAEQQPAPGAITAGMLEAIWRDGFDAENYDDQAYCQPLIIARIAVEEAQPTPDVDVLVEALEEIAEWVERWASTGHPIATVAHKALDAYRKGASQ